MLVIIVSFLKGYLLAKATWEIESDFYNTHYTTTIFWNSIHNWANVKLVGKYLLVLE